jgi:uncharacterized protein
MNPLNLIKNYYLPGSKAYTRLVEHSAQVAGLAEEIAARLKSRYSIDPQFISEAAWLHDIGIFMTDAPEIGCLGTSPYIAHGILGAKVLIEEGLPRHALVCERHIGVGLSIDDIREQDLPLPQRDMTPQTLEEQIVAYADLFFSKHRKPEDSPRPTSEVRNSLARLGDGKLATFDEWHEKFSKTVAGGG